MKLWMVLVFIGKVGGAIGPLPLSWEGCLKAQKVLEDELDEKFIEHYVWVRGRAIWLVRKDMGARCVASVDRPAIDAF